MAVGVRVGVTGAGTGTEEGRGAETADTTGTGGMIAGMSGREENTAAVVGEEGVVAGVMIMTGEAEAEAEAEGWGGSRTGRDRAARPGEGTDSAPQSKPPEICLNLCQDGEEAD